MRLINVRTMELCEFFGAEIPGYAILSHTWNDGEVTYQHWQDLRVASQRAGFSKIKGACLKAQSYDIEWLWVDTNCIDKTSSAELMEAINSMFRWYAKAEICFAYLSDVATAELSTADLLSKFGSSRWFTRGWTLQELLAPHNLIFYAADWSQIGSKDSSLADEIYNITGIDQDFLTGEESIVKASIAKKMSWVAKRRTTREEDIAYCMLGLFDINMPLLYGEGMKAFTRLQEEIIKVSNDHTIFCWSWIPSVPQIWVSLLAPSPDTFRDAGHFIRLDTYIQPNQVSIYSMTNAGLSIQLPVIYTFGHYLLLLEGISTRSGAINTDERPAIPVAGPRIHNLHVMRVPFPKDPVFLDVQVAGQIRTEPLTVLARLDRMLAMRSFLDSWKNYEEIRGIYGLMLTFDSLELREKWFPEIDNTCEPYSPTDSTFDTLASIWEIPIDRVRSHSAFTEVGGCLFEIGSDGIEIGRRIRVYPYVFLAVKVTRLQSSHWEKQWFCQIFVGDKYIDLGESERNATKLIRQVPKVDVEQRTHYCQELDVSLVIGSRVSPTRNQIRFLHVSNGRRKWVASNSAPDSNHSDGSGSENSSGNWTDADSDVAVYHGDRTLRALRRGQFKLDGFR